MSDEIGFEDKGSIVIPEKGDVREEKIISDVSKGIQRDQIKTKLTEESGTAPEKKGTLTKDVPQVLFKMGAKFIDCPKFELDDQEAQTMATHLNILIPLEGKMVSLVVILMIVVNKMYVCMDAIKRKANKGALEEKEEKPAEKLPEAIS
jgi:hypothetical protein